MNEKTLRRRDEASHALLQGLKYRWSVGASVEFQSHRGGVSGRMKDGAQVAATPAQHNRGAR
jgi:hypothetical protein